jgi:O-antigen/teichoic acid export membrane protein
MKGFVSNIYIKNFSWLLIEKIIRIFSGVLVGASVARYLAPEQFGLFNYALSFASMFTTFSTLGLDGLVVRELVKNNYTRDAILGTAFFLRLFGAFTVVFLVLLSMMIISLEYNTKILILIITCATIFQSFNVVDLFFQSQTLSKPVVIVNIITLLISSIIKIVFIVFKMPLITFAWIVLFESIFLSICFLIIYSKKKISISNWIFDKKIAISLLKDSFFYMISATIISFYMKIDQVMIGNILGPKDVGEYAVAAKLSELWYFIPIIISQSIFPSLEKTKIISKKLFYDKLEKLFVVGYLTSIFIILSTILLSKFVIITLYGIAYSNAVVVLIIHITSLIFVFQRVATEYWILSENLKYFEIIRTFISLIINVLLNIFLIKKYGISGAAISTVITLFFSGYLSFAFYKKAHPVFQIMTRTLLFQNLKILKIKK